MLCQVLGAPQIGISELVNPQHVACWMTTKSSANSASAASMKCAGTGICDNVDAQKESSGIQGKKITLKSKAPHLWGFERIIEGIPCGRILCLSARGALLFWDLTHILVSACIQGIASHRNTRLWTVWIENIFKIQGRNRGEHRPLDLGQNTLMVVLPCTFETWIHSVPYISLSIGHRVIFRACVTLRH